MNEQIERKNPNVEPRPKTVIPDMKPQKDGTKILTD